MKKAVIYCRVSTLDQSCIRQERDLTDFAARAGYDVIRVLKETASGAQNHRKKRLEALELAQSRKIDVILVTELTRWGRSREDLLSTIEQLSSWGVSLVAQTGLQLDLSTPQGKLFTVLLAALAEFERDLLRERIKSGIAARKARGGHIGRKPGSCSKAKRISSQVKKLRTAGMTYAAISRKLGVSDMTVAKAEKLDRPVG